MIQKKSYWNKTAKSFFIPEAQADPLQLKGLLSVLKKAAQGEDLGQVTLSTLQPLSATSLGNLKTKMTVLSRKDYPLTTSFPLSLRQLKVSVVFINTLLKENLKQVTSSDLIEEQGEELSSLAI